MTIKLIVGLRNPGKSYAKTRHNVGAWLLESLDTNWQNRKDLLSEVSEMDLQGHKLMLMLPTTFMNLSGQAVGAMLRYYRLTADEVLVVHDDLDLPVGALRIKQGGGHGGHNGLQDIIRHLGRSDFYRLRIGIGHPGDKSQVSNYVLHAPNSEELKKIEAAIAKVLPYLPQIVKADMAQVMNELHRKEE